MYDPIMVKPMREELTQVGIRELTTSDEVEKFMNETDDTSLVFVNSVCGCAAGTARPGLVASLDHDKKPARLSTVFAGVDKEAVDKARTYFVGYPPSSPSLGIFRQGKLVHMIERHDIEGTPAPVLGALLKSVYDKYCGEEIDESVDILDPQEGKEIKATEVAEMLKSKEKFMLLDCRDHYERERADIQGSIHLTQEAAEKLLKETDSLTPIVIFCHHGQRSSQAVDYFQQHGFTNVKSMRGGIQAWAEEVDSEMEQY